MGGLKIVSGLSLIVLGLLGCGVPLNNTPVTRAASHLSNDANAVDSKAVSAKRAPEANASSACADLRDKMTKKSARVLNETPFVGTVWLDSEIIIDSDPSAYQKIVYQGRQLRTMFDRRIKAFKKFDAHIYDAFFGSSTIIEIQVNSEFTQAESQLEARKYAYTIGQLPAFLLRDVATVWIHKGRYSFGGGNNNLLIHTGTGLRAIDKGILAETLIHEATHTSFDSYHKNEALWMAARKADGGAISKYAAKNPMREDLAETMGPYLALTFRPERISKELRQLIRQTIPNRIRYLDCLNLSIDILQ